MRAISDKVLLGGPIQCIEGLTTLQEILFAASDLATIGSAHCTDAVVFSCTHTTS
jgi:hypothetical protein